MSGLRAADRLLLPAVRAAVSDLEVGRADTAVVRLAEEIAAAIDAADPDDRAAALRDLGPKLLACLVELGATPKARKAVLTGGAADGQPPVSPLGRLRAAHRV